MTIGTTENGDALLCRQAQAGDAASVNRLIEEYIPLVRHIANRFRTTGGAEPDDLLQEGMIGLLVAVRAYDAGRRTLFSTFAYRCILNRILTAAAAAGKSLNVSLSDPQIAASLPAAKPDDPQEILIARETSDRWLLEAARRLSAFEQKALRLYLGGYSYGEMARLLQSSEKAVDNALQRARRKLRRKNPDSKP